MKKLSLLILSLACTSFSALAMAKPKEDFWNLGLGLSFVNLNEETPYWGVDFVVRMDRAQLEVVMPQGIFVSYAILQNFLLLGTGVCPARFTNGPAVPIFLGLKLSKVGYFQFKGGVAVNTGSLDYLDQHEESKDPGKPTRDNLIVPWGGLSFGVEI
jgi:hypothetical protein